MFEHRAECGRRVVARAERPAALKCPTVNAVPGSTRPPEALTFRPCVPSVASDARRLTLPDGDLTSTRPSRRRAPHRSAPRATHGPSYGTPYKSWRCAFRVAPEALRRAAPGPADCRIHRENAAAIANHSREYCERRNTQNPYPKQILFGYCARRLAPMPMKREMSTCPYGIFLVSRLPAAQS